MLSPLFAYYGKLKIENGEWKMNRHWGPRSGGEGLMPNAYWLMPPPSPVSPVACYFTTTVTFAFLPFAAVTVMIVLPFLRPFTTPLLLTFATLGAELSQ